MSTPDVFLGSAILVVDDDPPVLAMLRAVLDAEGYSVTTAVSAADARTKLAATPFDVVLTDIRMETELSGFEVVRAARVKSDSPAIVILTAYPLAEKDWRDAGADAGFSKPVPIAQLLLAVQRLLEARIAKK